MEGDVLLQAISLSILCLSEDQCLYHSDPLCRVLTFTLFGFFSLISSRFCNSLLFLSLLWQSHHTQVYCCISCVIIQMCRDCALASQMDALSVLVSTLFSPFSSDSFTYIYFQQCLFLKSGLNKKEQLWMGLCLFTNKCPISSSHSPQLSYILLPL